MATSTAMEILDVAHHRGEGQPGIYVHDFHVLGMLLRGRGYYRLGPCVIPDVAPRLVLLPAGEEDATGLEGPFESWYVCFRWGGLAVEPRAESGIVLGWAGRRLLVPRFKAMSAATAAECGQWFAALQAGIARQDLAGDLQARSAFLDLLRLYVEMPDEAGDPRGGHRALARFRALLQERACDPVCLEDLARETRLTADHLRGLFKQHYGVSPVAYRTAVRLARARELLGSTFLSVREVARETGYPDALYFSRAFRRHFGVTPTEVQQRARRPMG